MVLIPDFREITYQTPYQPKTGLLTVYQLFEVRGYLFLRVSTVSNKKKSDFHKFIFCDQNINRAFAGFYPRHPFFAPSMHVISP